MHGLRCTWLLTGALVIGVAATAPGQVVTFSTGIAVPQGPMAVRRAGGAQISVAIAPPHRVRGITGRAELTQGWFPRRGSFARTPQGQREGTLSVRSLLGYLLYTSAPSHVSFQAGLGGGACWMDIPGHPNPYPGATVELGALAAVIVGRGRVRTLFEIQPQLLGTDYGNGEFEASTFVPVRIGVVLQGLR